jgi:hypothetical protein
MSLGDHFHQIRLKNPLGGPIDYRSMIISGSRLGMKTYSPERISRKVCKDVEARRRDEEPVTTSQRDCRAVTDARVILPDRTADPSLSVSERPLS